MSPFDRAHMTSY